MTLLYYPATFNVSNPPKDSENYNLSVTHPVNNIVLIHQYLRDQIIEDFHKRNLLSQISTKLCEIRNIHVISNVLNHKIAFFASHALFNRQLGC
jgi:hypothetical protein